MQIQKRIFIAFLLNLSFCIFEFFGGMFTGSVAIATDAVHDFGDAVSLGLSCLLEKKASRVPDETHTYGYGRYSVLGGVVTTAVLLFGSLFSVLGAAYRLVFPVAINYDGMAVFALVGVFVNFAAACYTRRGDSSNLKAVNLHMLEDVLFWLVVLFGAVVMKFTDFSYLDSVLSIGISCFIFFCAGKNFKKCADVFLEKCPPFVSVSQVKACVARVEGVLDVHHVHLWSIDEGRLCAVMHVVSATLSVHLKEEIRAVLEKLGFSCVTLELETPQAGCSHRVCEMPSGAQVCHAHRH